MKKKDSVVDQLGKGVQALVKKKGVSVIPGTARLISGSQVEVSTPDSSSLINAKRNCFGNGF